MIKRESVKKGSVTTSLLNIVGRFVGFFSVFLISYFFGANSKTDVYYFMLSFTALIVAIFSSLQGIVFLPLFIKLQETDGKELAWKFLNSLLLYTMILIVVVGMVFVFFYADILHVFSQFSNEAIKSSKEIVLLFGPILVLMVLAEFLRTIIQSHYQFTYPAIILFFANLFMIVFLLLFGKAVGVLIMVISVICSYLFQCIFMFAYIKRFEPLFGFNIKFMDQHKEFLKIAAPVLITQLLSSFTMFFYDYSATIFTAGTLTAISFASRIFALPNDMMISPMSNVVSPLFSEHNAKQDYKKLTDDYLKYNNMVWYIIVPLSVFFIFYSTPIIEILFKRGHFNDNDVAISSNSLKYFSIGLFGLSYNAITTRAFFSLQKTLWISVSSFAINILSVMMTYFLIRQIGYSGISISRSASVIIFSVGSCILFSYMYIKNFKLKYILIPFLKMVSCSAIAGFLSINIYKFLSGSLLFNLKIVDLIFKFTISSIFYFITYYALSYFVKLNEFSAISNLFTNKYKRILKIN